MGITCPPQSLLSKVDISERVSSHRVKLFIYVYIFFNCRTITLQYCDGFFAIHQHEPAIGIHMSPPSYTLFPQPSPVHPSVLSQSTDFGFHRVDFFLSILWPFFQPIFSVEQAWIQSLQIVSGLGCWTEKRLSSDLFSILSFTKASPGEMPSFYFLEKGN